MMPLRLLLLEDSQDDAFLLLRALGNAGYVVDCERVDTREALQGALVHPWDLVISDHSMGKFSGREALQIVRKKDPELPFLFQAGTIRPGDLMGALREGARGCFSKDNLPGLLEAVGLALPKTVGERIDLVPKPVQDPLPKGSTSAKPRILLVDDHPGNLTALKAVLGNLDAELIGVDSGPEALKYLLSHEVALILLDVRMPEMGGVETAQILKSRPCHRSVPIIFLTAQGDAREEVARCYEAGAVDYLTKPFSPEILRAKVLVFLDLHRKNEQLNKQAAELLILNESLEAFSYSVSHDLRAPLRAIAGFGQILMEEYPGKIMNKEAQDYVRRIRQSATGMDALVRDLLSYAHLTRADLTLSRLNLKEVVGGILDEMKQEIQERQAHVRVEGPLGHALGHDVSLGRALENLIGNALKYTKPGRAPEVVLRTEERGTFVRLWVEDSGIGISPEDQANLFKVFSRLESAKPYQGTGLGLAIIKRALDRMNGQVGVESEVGKGSRFWIELPKA